MEIQLGGTAPKMTARHTHVVHDREGRIVHMHETIVLEGGRSPEQADVEATVLDMVGRGAERQGLTVRDVTGQAIESGVRYKIDVATGRLAAVEKVVKVGRDLRRTTL